MLKHSGRSHCHLGMPSRPCGGQDAAAPFDGDLQRLAEILGTLHYLRAFAHNEGPKWRNEMQALIDADPSGDAAPA